MHKEHKIKPDNIAILTSEESWFVPYARCFVKTLKRKGYKSRLFYHHKNIGESYQIVFMLSYFSVVDGKFLKKHKHSFVVHESDLPQGKGWAPLFWQVLEGKNRIPVVLFEASTDVDSGDIYIKDYIDFNGTELHDEVRELQANKTIEMCLRLLENYENIAPVKQKGRESYYNKRTPKDSELDINSSINEQFNLLRIVSNEEYPAFFYYKNQKYILKIYKK